MVTWQRILSDACIVECGIAPTWSYRLDWLVYTHKFLIFDQTYRWMSLVSLYDGLKLCIYTEMIKRLHRCSLYQCGYVYRNTLDWANTCTLPIFMPYLFIIVTNQEKQMYACRQKPCMLLGAAPDGGDQQYAIMPLDGNFLTTIEYFHFFFKINLSSIFFFGGSSISSSLSLLFTYPY